MLDTHLAAIQDGERAVGIVMESPPGIGKTANVFVYCHNLAVALNEPVALVQQMFATFTGPDVRGFMIPVKSQVPGELPQTVFSLPPWYPTHQNIWVVEPSGVWWKPGTWKGEMPDVGVLFLDEWGQADDEVKKPSAELIYNATVGTVELPPRWRVCAATNRTVDRSGVMREMMFIVNRRLLVKISGEVKPWIEWNDNLPEARRCHEMIVTFVQQHPSVVFRDTVPDGTDPYCTPRSLVMTDRVLKSMRSDDDKKAGRLPTTDLAREAAAGLIGEGAAAQFFVHMRFFNEIPMLADIETDPRNAILPKGKDGQMVCCYMLARQITEKNCSALVTYISRMNDEMQIMACGVFNSTAPAQKILLATKEYQALLFKHKNVLRASES
jgi:hypothetical protein